MESWPRPNLTTRIRDEFGPAPDLRLFDTRSQQPVTTPVGQRARLYVCGITPYDATHMGHAATYVTFDLAYRAWLEAGHTVEYVQNVTDVDDPLLERARERGIDWRDLAADQTQLFREDMTALEVIPPDTYAGAVETIPLALRMIDELEAAGATYELEGDIYFRASADPLFGQVSAFDRHTMCELSATRGGDPERPGKEDPLDCLLWQLERPGEPSWPSRFGAGRPGWHVECAAIALEYLDGAVDVQGGGTDLVFPHHEMSASEAQVARSGQRFAQAYAHQAMVGYAGHKMSKSRGNLVLVSALVSSGVDPRTIRLALLDHHYRTEWEWTDDVLEASAQRLTAWESAVARDRGPDPAATVAEVRAAMADDLDGRRALRAIDAWAAAGESDDAHEGAGGVVAAVAQASLGITLDG